MAAVPVTLVGIITTDAGSVNATFNGVASLSGLGVGGGPVFPPSDAHPEHPIAPGGERPAHPIAPGGGPPRPAHPIELPEPGHPLPEPPTEPPTNPADPQWVWGFNPSQGWIPVYVPGPTDPQPHSG